MLPLNKSLCLVHRILVNFNVCKFKGGNRLRYMRSNCENIEPGPNTPLTNSMQLRSNAN